MSSKAFICFTVAFLDESIQILSGRGSLISDIWVDLIGVVIGIVVGKVFTIISGMKNERK